MFVHRGVYLAAVFYHKDSLLVTAEDQIPIVEVDDSYSSSLMQDFLWFTKVRRGATVTFCSRSKRSEDVVSDVNKGAPKTQ